MFYALKSSIGSIVFHCCTTRWHIFTTPLMLTVNIFYKHVHKVMDLNFNYLYVYNGINDYVQCESCHLYISNHRELSLDSAVTLSSTEL